MEKRLILAITLSLLVLLAWSVLVPKPQLVDNKEVTQQVPETAVVISPDIKPAKDIQKQALHKEFPASSLVTVSQEKYNIIFIEPHAAIQEISFKAYQNYKFPLHLGFLLDDPDLVFQKGNITPESIDFVYSDKNKRIIKRFLLSNSNYSIELEIKIQNLSNLPLKISFPLILGILNLADESAQAHFKDVTIATKEKIMHLVPRKDVASSGMRFLGLRDRYFCAILEPAPGNYTGFIKKINNQKFQIGLNLSELIILPNQEIQQKFNIYLGPQELKQIASIQPDWTGVMHYGTFDIIAHILLQFLDILYRLVHNWGLVLIILSVSIYFLLYPLSLKQMRSMKQMQALQPQMEELRKLYKNNPQKLNKEIMELYRHHKVNPLSGCLPMILQIPVFFALYQVLMRSVSLKGAHFLWIKDLSEPDRLFHLSVSLPILGNEINILPILMAIGMFIQQKISMATTASGSAEQQKIMLIVFPLMFGLIFYHMPAGLVLYWFINSALMLIYQLRVSHGK